jgi:hypothetical protein
MNNQWMRDEIKMWLLIGGFVLIVGGCTLLLWATGN